ncbi:MAG: hypothetical protein JWO12_2655 [Frankiales bacterium]|nr:hypothetical protein [Frankiales bacterium]
MTTLSSGRAAATALRAGVAVRELSTPAATEQAAALLRDVWKGDESPVPANLLRTVQHTGGYCFGAYDDRNQLVAVSLALVTFEGLHSHITGVAPAGQRQGLGFAMKQHQRGWALDRGLLTISWTCDPLVRRNLVFNLCALGASVSHYLPDFYGPMKDGLNRGDQSDRLELTWDLLSEAAVRAESERLPFLDPADLPFAVAPGPVAARVHGPCLVQLPPDIETLRASDPAAAKAWRIQVREALEPRLSAGQAVLGITRAGALVLS